MLQSILALVQHLHWNVLSLVFEDAVEPLVTDVLEAIKRNPSLCISGTITRLTHNKIQDNILIGNVFFFLSVINISLRAF